MAGASLLALIDKIAVVLDDVALMTKVAAKKTAGVLGDDLALNAQQVSGVNADRELPVVWAVAKGSAKNKLILVPLALLISATLPWLITPLLMVGGVFLCFEGVEKVAHSLFESKEDKQKSHLASQQQLLSQGLDMVTIEKEKIKGAIRTDFILSAEIIVIALGTVQHASLTNQILVVSLIAVLMTVGVYGLVAAIVKLDDAGLYLLKTADANPEAESWYLKAKHTLGRLLLSFAPKLMRSLTVIGTIAMFLVGGSILVHGIPQIHHLIESLVEASHSWPIVGGGIAWIIPLFIDAFIGIIAGIITLLLVKLSRKMVKKR
ncbi:MAG: DUF808 domain-containing protein [Colwellia sp.]|nr:DUF808 domain-containing protein [Colwellia sp.]